MKNSSSRDFSTALRGRLTPVAAYDGTLWVLQDCWHSSDYWFGDIKIPFGIIHFGAISSELEFEQVGHEIWSESVFLLWKNNTSPNNHPFWKLLVWDRTIFFRLMLAYNFLHFSEFYVPPSPALMEMPEKNDLKKGKIQYYNVLNPKCDTVRRIFHKQLALR